jgi:hypothetical protein
VFPSVAVVFGLCFFPRSHALYVFLFHIPIRFAAPPPPPPNPAIILIGIVVLG